MAVKINHIATAVQPVRAFADLADRHSSHTPRHRTQSVPESRVRNSRVYSRLAVVRTRMVRYHPGRGSKVQAAFMSISETYTMRPVIGPRRGMRNVEARRPYLPYKLESEG